jgi:hypothetical protein
MQDVISRKHLEYSTEMISQDVSELSRMTIKEVHDDRSSINGCSSIDTDPRVTPSSNLVMGDQALHPLRSTKLILGDIAVRQRCGDI